MVSFKTMNRLKNQRHFFFRTMDRLKIFRVNFSRILTCWKISCCIFQDHGQIENLNVHFFLDTGWSKIIMGHFSFILFENGDAFFLHAVWKWWRFFLDCGQIEKSQCPHFQDYGQVENFVSTFPRLWADWKISMSTFPGLLAYLKSPCPHFLDCEHIENFVSFNTMCSRS